LSRWSARREQDSQPLPALLQQLPDSIAPVSGDGAYDTQACYAAVLERGATPVSVPRHAARPCAANNPTGWRATRNGILQQIATWRRLSGYKRQSLAGHTLCRFKRLCGGHLSARRLTTPRVEAVVKGAPLKRTTHLGRPETVRMGGSKGS
jgi:hypothetical protein